tara:strand:- start:2891 stop:3148 length:258 start_codon:yes stop_codon:yes gene_type:complete
MKQRMSECIERLRELYEPGQEFTAKTAIRLLVSQPKTAFFTGKYTPSTRELGSALKEANDFIKSPGRKLFDDATVWMRIVCNEEE